MRTVKINGVEFQVIKSHDKFDTYMNWHYNRRSGSSLEACYGKPSEKKRKIFAYWREWFTGADNVESLRIIAHSGYAFSLGAFLVSSDTGEVVGYIHITKGANRIYMDA